MILVRFRIDSSGRPTAISTETVGGPIPADTSDVAPAFASWRFPAGRERRGCELLFRLFPETVAAAAPETLYRFLALHRAARRFAPPAVVAAAFDRVRPPGSDCRTRPNISVQLRPPFDRVPQAPATVSYSFVNFDIDAGGEVRNARLASSSGNSVLDRESLRAVGGSRFEPSPRSGCMDYLYRRGEPLEAPPWPDQGVYRPAGATCPKEDTPWAHMPTLVFPVPFNRRGIEGWAIVRYDLGEAGETLNVEAADFAPAAAFAEQAVRIVRGARSASTGRALSGCTVRVRFELPPNGPAEGG